MLLCLQTRRTSFEPPWLLSFSGGGCETRRCQDIPGEGEVGEGQRLERGNIHHSRGLLGTPYHKGVLVKVRFAPDEGCGVVDPLPLAGGNSFIQSQVSNALFCGSTSERIFFQKSCKAPTSNLKLALSLSLTQTMFNCQIMLSTHSLSTSTITIKYLKLDLMLIVEVSN